MRVSRLSVAAVSFALLLALLSAAAVAWSGEPVEVLVERVAGVVVGALAWQAWRSGVWR